MLMYDPESISELIGLALCLFYSASCLLYADRRSYLFNTAPFFSCGKVKLKTASLTRSPKISSTPSDALLLEGRQLVLRTLGCPLLVNKSDNFVYNCIAELKQFPVYSFRYSSGYFYSFVTDHIPRQIIVAVNVC